MPVNGRTHSDSKNVARSYEIHFVYAVVVELKEEGICNDKKERNVPDGQLFCSGRVDIVVCKGKLWNATETTTC